jgi:polar amino acid transport system substrate-binding protein
MPQRRLLLAAALAGLAGLAGQTALLLAGGRAAGPANPPAAAIPSPTTPLYTVATDAVYVPFESLNERGEMVGFDIDVARAVAERAGIRMKFVNTPWEGMFNTLDEGTSDILVSAITITDERSKWMDFSDPYFDTRLLIAVRSELPVTRFADLTTLRVAVQAGTTADDAVASLLGQTNSRLRRFETMALALADLESGGADAVVADNGVVAHYVAQYAGTRFKAVHDPDFAVDRYGMAVRKGRADLLAQLNQGLASIRADGTLARIRSRYFGPVSTASAGGANPP